MLTVQQIIVVGWSQVQKRILCRQLFGCTHLQTLLERHVNNHFNEVSPNSGNGKKTTDSSSKLIRRNGKKLRYRRQPWSGKLPIFLFLVKLPMYTFCLIFNFIEIDSSSAYNSVMLDVSLEFATSPDFPLPPFSHYQLPSFNRLSVWLEGV